MDVDACKLYGCGCVQAVWMWMRASCMDVDACKLYGCGCVQAVWMWMRASCMDVDARSNTVPDHMILSKDHNCNNMHVYVALD